MEALNPIISDLTVTLAFIPSGLSCLSVQTRNNRGLTGELGSGGMLDRLATEQEETARSRYNLSLSLQAQHLSGALGTLTSDQLTLLAKGSAEGAWQGLVRGPTAFPSSPEVHSLLCRIESDHPTRLHALPPLTQPC